MITMLYAGLLGLIYIGLSLYVVRGRWAYKIGTGDGDNSDMIKRVRIHANFAEYVPLALLLLFLTDYAQYSPILIHILGAALVIGRILHVMGMKRSRGFTPYRAGGIILTLAVILVTSLLLIWKFAVFRLIAL